MRRGRATLLAVLAMVVAGPALAASATDPVSLGSGFVVDEADALSGGELSGADATLAKLENDTGISLYVALVPDFYYREGVYPPFDARAQENGLGDRQYLLAIATQGRQYTISASDDGPLTDAQLDAIEQSLVPQMRDGDWAGAIDTAADGIREAAGGGSGGSGGSGGGFPSIIIWIIVLAAVVVVIWLIVRSRRKKARGAPAMEPAEQQSTKELERRAGSALVATDDAIKTSEEELGFARAQFGDEATTEFEAALAAGGRLVSPECVRGAEVLHRGDRYAAVAG